MSHPSHTDPLTYETFFGLSENPFSLSSDPRFLYQSRSHAVAFDDLLTGIRRREGLIVLTGDIGTGKTTLCRAVLQGLDRKTYTAFVPDPFASREDLLKMLLIDFGVTSIHELTTGSLRGASRTELSYLLSSFLQTLASLEAFVVVIIDEAQNMSLPLIEEVRILSDTYNGRSQLQIVFVGQLELLAKLKLPEMRQVDQRVCVHARLAPLGPEAVPGYVRHRLSVAGGSSDRLRVTTEALDALSRGSRGVPRLINRICDRALHLAYLRRANVVDAFMVEAALDDIGQSDPPVADATSARADAPPESTFAERVDEWLARAEAAAKPSDVLHNFDSEDRAAEPSRISQPAGTSGREVCWRDETGAELRPQTYMERLRRRWMKQLSTAAAWLIAINGVVLGVSYLPGALAGMVQPPGMPALPDQPVPALSATAVPAPALTPPASAAAPVAAAPIDPRADAFRIEVALFSTRARAERAMQDLAAAGFPAFMQPLPLGGRGVMHQVLVGPFGTRVEAEIELVRLIATGEYGDARVVASSPPRS